MKRGWRMGLGPKIDFNFALTLHLDPDKGTESGNFTHFLKVGVICEWVQFNAEPNKRSSIIKYVLFDDEEAGLS